MIIIIIIKQYQELDKKNKKRENSDLVYKIVILTNSILLM